MRKLFIGATIAVLAGAVPASAQVSDPAPTAPCDTVDGATVLGLGGLKESFSPPAVPAAGHDLDDLAPRSIGVPKPPGSVNLPLPPAVPDAVPRSVPVPAAPVPLPGSVDVPLPPVGYHDASVERFTYVVDLSGSSEKPTATKASVSINLTWDNDSDFDMYVFDDQGNELDTADGGIPTPVFEAASLANVEHCTVLHVDVVNYAGLPNSAMQLASTIPSRSLR